MTTKSMHITQIRTCQPPCDSPRDWRTSLGQILVAVDTDSGLTGYGVGGGGLAGMHIVRTVLRDLLIGREVEPIETRWQEMYDATLAFGRKGVAVMASSSDRTLSSGRRADARTGRAALPETAPLFSCGRP